MRATNVSAAPAERDARGVHRLEPGRSSANSLERASTAEANSAASDLTKAPDPLRLSG